MTAERGEHEVNAKSDFRSDFRDTEGFTDHQCA
jgi:hypothetical protein